MNSRENKSTRGERIWHGGRFYFSPLFLTAVSGFDGSRMRVFGQLLLFFGALFFFAAPAPGERRTPESSGLASPYLIERERALEVFLSRGFAHILPLARVPSYQVRELALDAMERFPNRGKEELLSILLKDPEPSLRRKAARLLAKCDLSREPLLDKEPSRLLLEERVKWVLKTVGARTLDSKGGVKGFYNRQFEAVSNLGKECGAVLVRLVFSRNIPLHQKVLALCALGDLMNLREYPPLTGWARLFRLRLFFLDEWHRGFQNLYVTALFYSYMLDRRSGLSKEAILSFHSFLTKEKNDTKELMRYLSYALAKLGDPTYVRERIVELTLKLRRLEAEVSRVTFLSVQKEQEGKAGAGNLELQIRDLLDCTFSLAYEYQQINDDEKAASFYRKTVAIEEIYHFGASFAQLAWYNLACILAKKGSRESAVDCLEKALEKGFADFSWLMQDGDLDSIRDLPKFKECVEKWRK